MNFFMDVKHTAGIDDVMNFETFGRSMIILFQIATSAGWDGVLLGLMNDQEPGCNRSAVPGTPNGNCGNSGLAVLFLVTYLVISFLVVINMYIAVILENFSQATEDVQQGLTPDDFDMYYEKWEKYDPNATQYIGLDKVSDFVDFLDDPLRIAKPNHFMLVKLDITICEGDVLHCVDILDALTKNFLGTTGDGDLGEAKPPDKEKEDYNPVSSTLRRQKEHYAARIIQRAYRKYREYSKGTPCPSLRRRKSYVPIMVVSEEEQENQEPPNEVEVSVAIESNSKTVELYPDSGVVA